MAGEKFLFAPAGADARRLVVAARDIEEDIEIEFLDEEPGTYDGYPVMLTYWGSTPTDEMSQRLRESTGVNVRTERELEAAVSSSVSAA